MEQKRFSVRVRDAQGVPRISSDAVLGFAEWRTRNLLKDGDMPPLPAGLDRFAVFASASRHVKITEINP